MNNKPVSVLQIAAVSAAGHAFIGLLCVWAVIALLMVANVPPATAASDAFTSDVNEISFSMLLIFPLAFGVIGFVSGAIACHARNLYVSYRGGKRETTPVEPVPSAVHARRAAA
jgi:hypothetical protein